MVSLRPGVRLEAMTWGQAILQCRTKSEQRLFRLWLEEEHSELLWALPLLTPEAIDRTIETIDRASRSRGRRAELREIPGMTIL